MKYHARRNNLIVLCHECDRDITIEKQYYEKGVPYCEECNFNLALETDENTDLD